MATDITKEPSPGPKNLRLSRGSDQGDGRYGTITANWGNPASASSDSDHKWEWMNEAWTFKASTNMSKKWTEQTGSGHATGDLIWVRDVGLHETSTMWFDRTKYHPHVFQRFLQSVTADIYPCNRVKGWTGSHHAKATFTMKPPKKPTIAQEFDDETGEITFTVTIPTETGNRDRTDTRTCVMRRSDSQSEDTFNNAWASTTGNEKVYTIDTGNLPMIVPGQWYRYTCRAFSRGVAGETDMAESTWYHAYPAAAKITKIESNNINANGIVTITIRTNHKAESPVDEVTLQRLTNVDFSTARTAARASGWDGISTDDRQCKGFSDLVADARPAIRKHTWYRLKTKHGKFEAYSTPVEATCLYRESDAYSNDKVKFPSVTVVDDSSITVVMGETVADAADDDANAVEVTWSEHADAWTSTEQPSSFLVEWVDSTPLTGYAWSTRLTIRGLEKGKSYYIKARRVQTEDESHGPWCNPKAEWYPMTIAGEPTSVELTAPSGVPRGSGMDVSWTFTGEGQTAWSVSNVLQNQSSNKTPKPIDGLPHELYRYIKTTDTAVNADHTYYSVVAYTADENDEVPYTSAYQLVASPTVSGLSSYYVTEARKQNVLMSGDGTDGGCTIPAEVIGNKSSLMLVACVTCGSEWAYSNVVPVAVADPPTVAVAVSTLTAQPLAIGLSTDCSGASATIVVTSRGVYGDSPTGTTVQAEGDVVWSAAVTPGWVVDNGLFAATVTAPSGLDLRQGGVYDVTVSVTDPISTLSSGEATAFFSVDWAHEATCPSPSSWVHGYVDELQAVIKPIAPTGAAGTDVVDIYRVTADGAYLIAGDVPFGTEITDPWAPYSNGERGLYYRLCTRTVDGDIDWEDYEYELMSPVLRIDFGGNFVELPYNLTRNDSWSKGFEARTHLDGSTVGYWDEAVSRTASFTTDIIRIDTDRADLVRELAQYPGACFVRTPDGCAFQANVDVTGLDRKFGDLSIAVSITANEVALTDEYRVPSEGWG